MSRRVRFLSAALLALSLVINVPAASAAVVDRDGGLSIREKIVQILKKVLLPFASSITEEDEFKPQPPRP